MSALVLLGGSSISLLAEGERPEELFFCADDSLSFSASAAVTSSWDAQANIDLIFTNCGEETIHNWCFIFDLPYEIENIWNGSIIEHRDGVYSVTNVGWNQDIPVGGSVTVGFTAASTDGTDVTVMPTFFLLNTEKIEVDADAASLTYQEYSAWGSGFTGALSLSHSLEHTLTDWSVSFSCNRPILQVNNGILSQSDDGACLIYNDGNHQNVEVGTTQVVGIQGGVADTQIPFELSDVHVFMWTQVFSLTEDENANGVADYLDFISGGQTDPGPNLETDTDGDGIPDYFELEWGTDPHNMDTDGDGIDDLNEFYCGLDPLTSDADEDFDGDGLTLEQEQAQGTAFWNADTDYDGLSDGDEVNVHGTEPINEDIDGDGLFDGDEIALGLNPLNAATHGVPDIQYTQSYVLSPGSVVFSDINTEESPYVMSLEITASGNVPEYLVALESSYSATVHNDAMLGLVAELEYDGRYIIDEVKLKFEVQDEFIPNVGSAYAAVSPEFEGIKRYCVFRYFEDINMLLPVETYYDEENQLVYAITDMVGTYCLIDMDQWLESIGVLPMDIVEYSASESTENSSYTNGSSEYALPALNSPMGSFGVVRRGAVQSTNQVRCERFNGHRYAVIDTGDMSWTDAKAYCEYMGGHLVTITDEREQAYINSFLLWGNKNLYWIGAYRDGTQFRWITGETFEYENWDGGEPSNEQENVVHMYRNSWLSSQLGTWNDTSDYVSGTAFHSTINVGLLCEWETPVNILYGASLRSCTKASELTNLADADWDNDGIPNWKEIRIDSNLGYWNFDGTYVPATLKDYMGLKSGLIGFGAPFLRFSVNPVIIPVISTSSNPEKADSDGDGLMDGAAQYVGNKKVAPKDPDPNKANGPIGVWQALIERENSGTIPTALGDWYYFDGNGDTFNLKNVDFSELDITSSESVYAFLKKYGCTPDLTSIGSRLLWFRMDNRNEALHSNTKEQVVEYVIQQVKNATGVSIPEEVLELIPILEQWQKIFGYNDLIDEIFKFGTNGNMDRLKLEFNDSSGKRHIVWIWRGDYINCGNGAEIGLYSDPKTKGDIEFWKAAKFNLPMTLNLYYYGGQNNIDDIFCWAPNSKQWWITGFNPDYMTLNVKDMVVLGSVDCSGCPGMYASLKDNYENDSKRKDYLIFDEDSKTVWIIWWQK